VSALYLPSEEEQIWALLAHVAADPHPDATACRLHLSLKSAASGQQLPWHVGDELQRYCHLLHKIDTACRLSVQEEMALLRYAKRALNHP
jgi:hypothetical protein